MYKLFFIVLCVLGIRGTTMTHRKRHAAKGILPLSAHLRLATAFPCEKPQLRAIPVQELIQNSNPDEEYYPPTTVLARCDTHTGCCKVGHVCGPNNQLVEEVELYFVVNHATDKSRPQRQEVIKAANHTECKCHTL